MSNRYRQEMDFAKMSVGGTIEALMDRWFGNGEEDMPSYVVMTNETLAYGRMESQHNRSVINYDVAGMCWLRGIPVAVFNTYDPKAINFMELVR